MGVKRKTKLLLQELSRDENLRSLDCNVYALYSYANYFENFSNTCYAAVNQIAELKRGCAETQSGTTTLIVLYILVAILGQKQRIYSLGV